VCQIAREAGVISLVDGCQAVGHLDVDVGEIGCDFLSATGRKYLRGPRGTGFLFARDDVLERVMPSQPDHHGADWVSTQSYDFQQDARRFEYWEHNHAAWLGLGVAVDQALEWGTDRIAATVIERGAQLRRRLEAIGWPTYDLGEHRCGIVTTTLPTMAAADVHTALRQQHINTSFTLVGSSRYDVEHRGLPSLLRLSVHYTTTVDELDRTVEALARLSR
jgi:selenocysteine lyase/cysteine desulfurase